jgi:hypothetical protein
MHIFRWSLKGRHELGCLVGRSSLSSLMDIRLQCQVYSVPRLFYTTNQTEASGAKVGRKRHPCGGYLAGGFPGLVDIPSLNADMRDHIGGLLGFAC